MREWLAAGERGLFIRSYIALAGGLLIVAILLDVGFGALQARQTRAADPWLVSTLRLMESDLAATREENRAARATELGHRLGLDMSLLDASDISGAVSNESGPRELVDDSGKIFYLWSSPSLNGVIRLGPFEPPHESLLMRFLPVAFYASILLIVGLWLRPLLTDLRLLTLASQKFATDYREPLDTAKSATQLTSLAANLDDMSARVSQLIESQKEMTAALSHEMRTPLSAVLGWSRMLASGELDPVKAKQAIDAIQRNAQAQARIVDDILDVARGMGGDLRLDLKPFDLVVTAVAGIDTASVDDGVVGIA